MTSRTNTLVDVSHIDSTSVPLPWSRWPRISQPTEAGACVKGVVVDSFWDPDGLQRVTHCLPSWDTLLAVSWSRPRHCRKSTDIVCLEDFDQTLIFPRIFLQRFQLKSTRSKGPARRAAQLSNIRLTLLRRIDKLFI